MNRLRSTCLFSTLFTLLTLWLAGIAPRVRAEDERVDRARYDKLVEQARLADAQFVTAFREAVDEARKNDGEASLDARNKVLAARDARDRLVTRILILSQRHGWDVPSFDPPTQGAGADSAGSSARASSQKEMVFEPAAQLIRERFAEESRSMARAVKLPLIGGAESLKPRART